MKKNQPTTQTPDENIWDEPVKSTEPAEVKFDTKPAEKIVVKSTPSHPEYDIDGLMTDFPTAKELERFVYDETGHVLNLKGRANKLKYQVAMDVLNGQEVDPKFFGDENPYVDRAELIPEEPLKPTPARDTSLPDPDHLQNSFTTKAIPHPDPDYRARNRKVMTTFRKYRNGMISYEVVGPIEPRAVGEKMDKFGKMRPEYMTWVDPRTGEQVVVREDGTLTPMGRNLRALMQKMRVNNSNQWQVWVDRDFVQLEGGTLQNPWDIGNE